MTLIVMVGVVAKLNHSHGIDWGDDFALYVRQAKAVTIGNIGEVIGDNRFTVDNSGWHTFSPYAYPWGWPLLLAPLYAIWGVQYGAFKLLEIAALCGFLCAFWAVTRVRAGAWAAAGLAMLVGLSPAFVRATDTVISDLPYLCFAGLSFWWMDRCRKAGLLGGGRREPVILGLLLAYTFNIRREGILLLVSLTALHVGLLAERRTPGRWASLRDVDWRAVLLPYAVFGLAVLAFHLLLPTELFADAPGTGPRRIASNISYYRGVIADHMGLKDRDLAAPGLGSEAIAVAGFVVLAGIGLVARLAHYFTEDVPLAAYLCSASLLMLLSPYQDSRYLFTITPLLAYFAYQAAPAVARLVTPRQRLVGRLARALPQLGLAVLVAVNAADLVQLTNDHLRRRESLNGPERPAALQMFTAVREVTREDEVILFFRPRAMTLYTDRVAIQGEDLDLLLRRADWYVMAKNNTDFQRLISAEEASARGLAKTWENDGWVIWSVPRQDPVGVRHGHAPRP